MNIDDIDLGGLSEDAGRSLGSPPLPKSEGQDDGVASIEDPIGTVRVEGMAELTAVLVLLVKEIRGRR